MEHYCLPEFDGVQEFLSLLAKRLGKLLKGEVITLEELLVNLWVLVIVKAADIRPCQSRERNHDINSFFERIAGGYTYVHACRRM